MAVVDSAVGSGSSAASQVSVLRSLYLAPGASLGVLYNTFEVASGDDDGSKYRIWTGLPNNLIPIEICVANDAITSGTDYVLGLYDTSAGAVISANCFMTTTSMASARASLNPKTAADGMVAVAIENYYRRLYEHAGHNALTLRSTYDIVLTANTVGSANGTISLTMKFAIG